jgi:hypothetical protein
MPATADVIVPVERLSPADGQYFFGYYDVPGADAQGRHLCHRVPFRDHHPEPGDTAQIGWTPLPGTGEPGFHNFAATTAWNFQQSSMLQWLGSAPDTCLYNVFAGGRFGACVHNLATGDRRLLPRAVANVARDGTKALCVNMPRIFDFRPGYGYEELPDAYADVKAPEDDGVFVMDLATGDSRLVLSLAEAVSCLEACGEEAVRGQKVVINHITFNPSASRYLFLLRTFPDPPGHWPWATFLLTADTNGGGLRNHPCWGIASHYHWRNDQEMLFWAKPEAGDKLDLFTINADTGEHVFVDRDFFRQDGHCSHSPDGRWLLYDSYPDGSTEDYMRGLILYSLDRHEGVTIGRFRSEKVQPGRLADLRCDLHPRWMPDGKAVSFDSVHEGYRGVYWADVSGIVG